MPLVPGIRTWLTVVVLGCVAALCVAVGAAGAAAPAFTPVARSTLVTLEAAGSAEGLSLRVRRTQGGEPLSVTDLAVSVGGRKSPATRRADGTWFAPWPGPGRGGELEVIVVHEGIREELTGSLPPPVAGGSGSAPAAGGGGLLHGHKQMAWWLLNIAIVLIAAIAISRRMS